MQNFWQSKPEISYTLDLTNNNSCDQGFFWQYTLVRRTSTLFSKQRKNICNVYY